MGPPTQSPYWLRSRNFTASRTSEYLVAMPMRAVTHSQNRVPGPPRVTAVVMPAMLPVPTVPARAVETAWKGVISPSPASRLWKILPMVFFMAYPNLRNWSPLLHTVIRIPTPMSRMSMGAPHTTPLMAPLMVSINCIVLSLFLLIPRDWAALCLSVFTNPRAPCIVKTVYYRTFFPHNTQIVSFSGHF